MTRYRFLSAWRKNLNTGRPIQCNSHLQISLQGSGIFFNVEWWWKRLLQSAPVVELRWVRHRKEYLPWVSWISISKRPKLLSRCQFRQSNRTLSHGAYLNYPDDSDGKTFIMFSAKNAEKNFFAGEFFMQAEIRLFILCIYQQSCKSWGFWHKVLEIKSLVRCPTFAILKCRLPCYKMALTNRCWFLQFCWVFQRVTGWYILIYLFEGKLYTDLLRYFAPCKRPWNDVSKRSVTLCSVWLNKRLNKQQLHVIFFQMDENASLWMWL